MKLGDAPLLRITHRYHQQTWNLDQKQISQQCKKKIKTIVKLYSHQTHATVNHVLGVLIFALILSRSSSLVSVSWGKRFRFVCQHMAHRIDETILTAASHLRISSRVQLSGSPVGSFSGGNISLPQMTLAVAATTTRPKAIASFSTGPTLWRRRDSTLTPDHILGLESQLRP